MFIPLNKWQYKFYGRISSDGKYQSQVWDYYPESGEVEPRSAGRRDPCVKTCPPWRRLSPAERDAGDPGCVALFPQREQINSFWRWFLKIIWFCCISTCLQWNYFPFNFHFYNLFIPQFLWSMPGTVLHAWWTTVTISARVELIF